MPQETPADVAGTTLVVREWASAESSRPPVLLLPATGETADDWDQVASVLSRTRNVCAVNLRGHGASDWPGTYSIQLMADDVVGLLNGGCLGPSVDLVGHSLGGLVGCLVAAACPDRVRRLVLEDVGLLHARPADPPAKPEGELAFDWAVVEQVRPEIDNFDPGWADVVATIGVPTLVIAGGPTSPVPHARIVDLVRQLPQGEMVTVDAGHNIHATAPEEFIQLLLSFLK